IFGVPAALVRAPAEFFTSHPIESQIAAATVRDASPLLVRLLDGGHPIIAGRLAGLLRRLGKPAIAEEIVSGMKAADHDVRVVDPLESERVVAPRARTASPIVARLQTLWATMRDAVLAELPDAPGLPKDRDLY